MEKETNITVKQFIAGMALYFGSILLFAVAFSMGITVGRYGEKWWVLIALVGLFWLGVGVGKLGEINKQIHAKP